MNPARWSRTVGRATVNVNGCRVLNLVDLQELQQPRRQQEVIHSIITHGNVILNAAGNPFPPGAEATLEDVGSGHREHQSYLPETRVTFGPMD